MARKATPSAASTGSNQTNFRAACATCKCLSPEYPSEAAAKAWRDRHDHDGADTYHGVVPDIHGVLGDW